MRGAKHLFFALGPKSHESKFLSALPSPENGGTVIEFETEVFISYAHLDNQPLEEGSKGWVSHFHQALEVRIGQLLGKQPLIWRDPKLQGNDYFGDTLIDRLPGVGVLVSVVTPRYVKSEWCHKELEEFYKASEKTGGVRMDNKSRVFKVLKTPVAIDQHPVELQLLLGYDFFKVDTQTGRAHELNKVFGPEAERDFWIKLDDLAQDICALLNRLETDIESFSLDKAISVKGFVYLAETSFDLKEQRETIRRDLLGHGYEVLPEKPLPLNAPDLETFVQQELERCRLSIHLIGMNYGIVPEGTEHSVVMLQNELAIQREGQSDIFRLIWMPPNLKVEDKRQQRFIESLRSDPRIQQSADLLETSIEDLKTQVHELLESIANPKEKKNTALEGAIAANSVYLICDARDLENIYAVADYLFENCEVVLPAFEGDEEEVRKDHEENLRTCDGVLIYYGAANDLWLRCKLRELHKIAGLGRTRPLRAKAILAAPPVTPQKKLLRTHEAMVIHQPDSFNADDLEPFLAELKQEPGAPD